MTYEMSEIESVARKLCLANGDHPDIRIPEYGRTTHSYPAWEDYRELAMKKITREAGP